MDEKTRVHVKVPGTLWDYAASLVRPSGGLYYHGRAWWNGKRWQPFADEVAKWLDTWPCPKDELILIGPSAGYTLPTGWLAKFGQITAFDLDPLAGFLFRRRHRMDVKFHRVNLFWSGGNLSLHPLLELLSRHPKSSILFCNILGQVLLEGTAAEDEWLAFLRKLRHALRGRHWASYHDVTSMTTRGPFGPPDSEVIDHMTGGDWAADLAIKKLQWHLGSHRLHDVQAVWERP